MGLNHVNKSILSELITIQDVYTGFIEMQCVLVVLNV